MAGKNKFVHFTTRHFLFKENGGYIILADLCQINICSSFDQLYSTYCVKSRLDGLMVPLSFTLYQKPKSLLPAGPATTATN